jgi:hypothetical protein
MDSDETGLVLTVFSVSYFTAKEREYNIPTYSIH